MHTSTPETLVQVKGAQDPLCMWTDSVEEVTSVKRVDDIKEVYRQLVDCLNECWYGNALAEDPDLFVKGETSIREHDSFNSDDDSDF